jgi:peptidyl-prolyl cis-trans isomerase C
MTTKRVKVCLPLAVLIILLGSTPVIAEDEKPLKKTAATVNGAVITQNDISREVQNVRDQAARRGKALDEAKLPKLKQDILDRLINKELLYQESQKSGVEIDPSAVDQEWEKITARFPDKTQLKEALQQVNLSESIIKSQIEKQLAISQFVKEQITDKIVIAPEEAKEYYDAHPTAFKKPEEVKASHILIKLDEDADQAKKDAAMKKIKEVQAKLSDGADFADLAKTYSEGPSKTKGGDLGSFRRGQMVKPFEEAAFALSPGEVSDVVETRFGYHIIKVDDKQPESQVEFEAVKDRLENFLRQTKTQEALKEYLPKLEKEAKIKRFPLT